MKVMVEEKNLTVRQACRIIGMPRSNYNCVARPNRNEPVHEQLRSLIERHPAIGFWQSYHRIR